jgi:hypothetical protein
MLTLEPQNLILIKEARAELSSAGASKVNTNKGGSKNLIIRNEAQAEQSSAWVSSIKNNKWGSSWAKFSSSLKSKVRLKHERCLRPIIQKMSLDTNKWA